MEAVLALAADNTHLYPGARLTADDLPAPPDQPTEVVVVFRDHSHADGLLTPSANGLILHVEAYATVAGTAIGPKSWQVKITEDRLVIVGSRVG
ncbi:MAG: hypothetical protein QM655_03555 [Nocardioidaceae bacterium]